MRVSSYEEAVALGPLMAEAWLREMAGTDEKPSGLKSRKEAKSPVVTPPAVSKAGGMNKTEARFARGLDHMQSKGLILCWEFEPMKFRIAERCWYGVDFRLVLTDFRSAFVEVKGGFIREDAAIKLKTVAEVQPYPFFLAQWQEKVWTITRMPSRKWGEIAADIEWDI